MNQTDYRPRTQSPRRRYTPSPLPPPSRRSLPDLSPRYYTKEFTKPEYTYREPRTYREPADQAPNRNALNPNNKNPNPNPVIIPAPEVKFLPALPPPQIQTMAQPPQIIQSPPQTIYQQIPQPVVHNLGPAPPEKSHFNKGDFMEMMMMQSVQMNQAVMQQLMMDRLPGRSGPPSCVGSVCEPMRSPVHHHHYSGGHAMPAPAVHHYASLPQIDVSQTSPTYRADPGLGAMVMPPEMMPYSSGEYAIEPPDIKPLVTDPPANGPIPNAKVRKTKVPSSKAHASKSGKPYPFPGPKGLRKLRHLAYAALFVSMLKTKLAKKEAGTRPSTVFLFGIILKEIVAALHRIFLNPRGNIYPVISDIIVPKAPDLSLLLDDQRRLGERERAALFQELQYVIENLTYHITEIMPSTGVLGTHKKAAVYELIKNDKRFPDGYFWTAELDKLTFTEAGRTANMTDGEAFILMVGIFISRSLITTLLLKPIEYGLSQDQLTNVALRNLRITASTMLFLVRQVSSGKQGTVMAMPAEVGGFLYSDADMMPIYNKLRRTFEYCEGLLVDWGTEYIRRLRSAGPGYPQNRKD